MILCNYKGKCDTDLDVIILLISVSCSCICIEFDSALYAAFVFPKIHTMYMLALQRKITNIYMLLV